MRVKNKDKINKLEELKRGSEWRKERNENDDCYVDSCSIPIVLCTAYTLLFKKVRLLQFRMRQYIAERNESSINWNWISIWKLYLTIYVETFTRLPGSVFLFMYVECFIWIVNP